MIRSFEEDGSICLHERCGNDYYELYNYPDELDAYTECGVACFSVIKHELEQADLKDHVFTLFLNNWCIV